MLVAVDEGTKLANQRNPMLSISPLRTAAIVAAFAMILAPVPSKAVDTPAGGKLYVDNCQRCHGNKGQGGVGKKLVGDAAYWDFPVFKRTVIEGIDDENKKMKVMPVFGKVGLFKPQGHVPSDDELQDIQSYLKTFGPAE
jgi:mono/diheme cytochrome c family protein